MREQTLRRLIREEIVNHFKNLKYRWQGDTLIFEAKWSDFKHTKGFVHIPLGIKTELSNSDRKKITVLTDLELNKNKSFQKSFHDFSIYIKEGSLWMMISPAGKRDIREKMKENKNYLRELIDRIKKAIVRGKVNEGRRRKEDYKVYHPSFTSAATAAKEYAQRKGYEIDEDGWWNSVATGGRYTRSRPSVGKTHKFSVELTKGGKPQRKQLHFQVHGMDSGYELNAYIQ